MKIFFCDGTGKDKYGNPEKSNFMITFETIAFELRFPYQNINGDIKSTIGPRDWYLPDDKLIEVDEISEISETDVPIRFKKEFIRLSFKVKK